MPLVVSNPVATKIAPFIIHTLPVADTKIVAPADMSEVDASYIARGVSEHEHMLEYLRQDLDNASGTIFGPGYSLHRANDAIAGLDIFELPIERKEIPACGVVFEPGDDRRAFLVFYTRDVGEEDFRLITTAFTVESYRSLNSMTIIPDSTPVLSIKDDPVVMKTSYNDNRYGAFVDECVEQCETELMSAWGNHYLFIDKTSDLTVLLTDLTSFGDAQMHNRKYRLRVNPWGDITRPQRVIMQQMGHRKWGGNATYVLN